MITQFFEVQTRPGPSGPISRPRRVAEARSRSRWAVASFIDRFSSLTRENLLLSYQVWQDEGAMTAWRVHGYHHKVQTIGREKVFSDYRIRIAQIIHEAKAGKAGLAAGAAHAVQPPGATSINLCRCRGIETRRTARCRPSGAAICSRASIATTLSRT